MKMLLIVLLLGLMSCQKYELTRGSIEECQRDKLAEFVLKCAEVANPMSDEEGEDLVQQCEWTGRSIFCKSIKVTCMSKHSINSCRGYSDYDIKEVVSNEKSM